MALLRDFTRIEKVATIAFLKMVAHSDLIIKDEEIYIINLLANNIGVTDHDIEEYGEMKLRLALKSMTRAKTIELLRMGYSILDVDNDIHIDEIKILNYIAMVHNIDLDDDKFISSNIYTSKELTALDQIVLISLAFQMVYADGKVMSEETELLKQIFLNFHLNIEDIKGLIVPLDILIKAVKTMSGPSVMKILEELIRVAMSDGEFSKEEFDVIFPLLSEFNINLKDLIDKVI